MDKELLAIVRERVVEAEKEYEESIAHIRAIERAELVLQRIRQVREEKLRCSESVKVIDAFLGRSQRFFDQMVKQSLADETFNFDFATWADEVEREMINQDPLMLSFASGSEDAIEPITQPISQRFLGAREASTKMQTFSSFMQILQTNGKFKPDAPKINTFDDSRLFCITMLAWISAVIAMIIAIGFLSNDFYIAQRNFAAFIDQVNVSNVAYPAVTVCADIPRAPLFLNYPNKKYPGVPLFGLTRFSARNSTSGQMYHIAFPDTIPTGNNYFEEVVSGPYPAACKAMKKSTSLALNQKALFHLGDLFEAEGGRAKAALTNSSQECYWCIRAGFTPRVEAKVENHHGGDSGPSAPPFQLTFFRSKLVAGCTTLLGFRDAGTRGFIAAQLENHARALAERGTLDFANQSPSKALQAVSFGFNHSSFLRSVDYRAAMEFACNVYFYSGYFYPTDDAPDIRYRYEHSTKSWMQTGAGPYYQTQAWDKNAPALLGPGQVGVERDLYTTNIAQVLFQDPDKKTENKGFVPMSAKIANIEADGVIFLDIERTSDNGKVDYKVDIQGIGSQTNEALGYSSFSIGMAYKSPFTTSIDYVATMSWSEYLTDVFEFVGLFTGVCVFTLLVAPAHSFVE